MTTHPPKRLWKCPRCGRRFAGKNMWHSCGRYDVRGDFSGKPASLRRTFNRFVSVARSCRPITVYAQKTRIAIQARVRFAGAVVRAGWLDAGVWLKRRASDPRLHRTEFFGRTGFGFHFRLTQPEEVDAALARIIREAYRSAVEAPRRTGRPAA